MDIQPPEPVRVSLSARLVDLFTAEHRLAYAHLSPGLMVLDPSANFHEYLSEPAAQVEGRPLAELLWEFVGAEEELRRVAQGESPVYRLERVNRTRPDGSIRYLDFSVYPYDSSNPGEGCLLILEEVTETGRLEQRLVQDRNELRLAQAELALANADLQRLDRLKSIFLSIAAHDLRAPLSVIMGYADLLLAELDPDPRLQGYLAIITSQVKWMDRLIDDFLSLDQIEQGKISLRITTCDLNFIVRQVTEESREPAGHQGLELLTAISEGTNLVQADPGRLAQILYNLIGNAIKYTPEGGQVLISTWQEPGAGFFSVKDNGIGITPEDFKHLFGLYYRTSQARRSGRPGSGLGLYIVKTFVEAMQGQIQAASQEGAGTTFTVRLPAGGPDTSGEPGTES